MSRLLLLVLCLATAVKEMRKYSFSHGEWTFSRPRGNSVGGEFLYHSPQGRFEYRESGSDEVKVKHYKTCSQYLTFGLQHWLCKMRHVNASFVLSKECVTDTVDNVVHMIDMLNVLPSEYGAPAGTKFLEDTCIRGAALHKDQGLQILADYGDSIKDASWLGKAPKHGWIVAQDSSEASSQQLASDLLGIPLIQCDSTTMDIVDNHHEDYTQFRMMSDLSWAVPAIMDLLPRGARFGVLYRDGSVTYTDPALRKAAAERNQELVSSSVLPRSYDDSAAAIVHNTRVFLEQMVQQEVRWIVMAQDGAEQYTVLACEMLRMGVAYHFDVVTFTMPFYASGYPTACDLPDAMELAKNMTIEMGWTGLAPDVPDPSADLRLNNNREEDLAHFSQEAERTLDGSYDLDPKLFNMTHGLGVSAEIFANNRTGGSCRDDDSWPNSSRVMRSVLGADDSQTLTCKDIAFIGQSRKDAFILDVATHCPVAVCEYNWVSNACRLSCACTPPNDGTNLIAMSTAPLPGTDPHCVTGLRDLRMSVDPQAGFAPSLFKCKGKQCRPLHQNIMYEGQPGLTWSAVGLNGDIAPWAFMGAISPDGWCPNKYDGHGEIERESGCATNLARVGVSGTSLPTMVDGVVALALAFRCLERHEGAAGLARAVSYNNNDRVISRRVLKCLREEVDFDGFFSRVRFGYHQSPYPGDTTVAVSQMSQSRDAAFQTIGFVKKGGSFVFARTIRRSLLECVPWTTNNYAPGYDCPPGSAIIYDFELDNIEALPLGRKQVCEAGYFPLTMGDTMPDEAVPSARMDECVPCLPGTIKRARGDGRCIACSFGYIASERGMTQCSACPINQYAVPPVVPFFDVNLGFKQQPLGSVECRPCPPGSFALPGSEECTACGAGSAVEDPGSPKCDPCPLGTYVNSTTRVCDQCPPTLTTLSTGAVSAEECGCAPNFYLDHWHTECKPCPDQAICLGGRAVPMVPEGYFALRVPRESKFVPHHFQGLEIWECPFASSCVGTVAVPLASGMVPARRVDECSDPSMSRFCSRCPDGYYMTTEKVQVSMPVYQGEGYPATDEVHTAELSKSTCSECTAGSGAPFPVVVILSMVVIYFLYRFSKAPRSQALTGAVLLSSLGSLLATTLQTLGVIGSFDLNIPDFMRDILAFMKIFLFDIEMLNAVCFTGVDFSNRFFWRVITPVAVLLMFYVTMHVSWVLSKTVSFVEAMGPAKTMNALGLVLSAAYITMCKVAFQFFECRPHPSAPATLVAYPDITCTGDDRTKIMWAGATAIILYPIAVLAVMVFLVWIAPKEFSKSNDFRLATAFLLTRWQPTMWYFGVVVMFRNALIAFIGVLYPADGIPQLAWTATILGFYTAGQSAKRPWRNGPLNMFDSSLCMGVAILCAFLLSTTNPRGDAESRYERFYPFVTLFFTMAGCTMLFVVVYCTLFFLGKVDNNSTSAKKTTTVLMNAVRQIDEILMAGLMKNKQVDDRIQKFLTTGEQLELVHLMSVALREVFQIAAITRSSSKRLFLNSAGGSQRASGKQIQELRRQLTASQRMAQVPKEEEIPATVEF
mmetsp:Transcript_67265/g.154102  ORF Transcript_67265/g.154102 Transcript_67265/m.154102 type:complete len:1558 (+) Transcript_67265:78-4751(+)